MRILTALILLFPLLAHGDVSSYYPYEKEVREWQKFYKEQFEIQRSFSFIRIPKSRLGYNRLLIIVPELKSEQIFNRIEKVISTKSEIVTTRFSDLNAIVPEPKFSKNYAVWVKDNIESDLSLALDNPNKLLVITLEERLVFELKYFLETGQHLDIRGYTHCINARDAWWNYAVVTWYPGQNRFTVDPSQPLFNLVVPTREVIR